MLKLRGLYYITHIDNLHSILNKGILCHKHIEEENIEYTSIYDKEIVSIRNAIKTADGRCLWDFVNLYFQPRNAMLYRVSQEKGIDDIAVIGIKNSILKKDGIIVTNGNAASPNSDFLTVSKVNIKNIKEQVDREWWAPEDGSKRKLMAECLVPDRVEPKYISDIYVANREALGKVRKICQKNIPIIPEPELFFLPTRKIPLTETLSLVEGDMFFSRMQTLTISVNTVGVMGKGLASRAKYQFPRLYVTYQDLCKKNILQIGKPYLYKGETSLDYQLADEPEKLSNANLGTWFILFPTKKHWKEKADITGIENGLKWLVKNYEKEGIKSLAVPSLGCGLGWLEWEIVGPILCNYLKKLNIPVNLYLPLEKKIPDEQLSKDFLLNDSFTNTKSNLF
ncbi:DUF4433 domain-containing protein [bacterium]|nr:MAG: DUF4433 domain-containing protein [bacterium]